MQRRIFAMRVVLWVAAAYAALLAVVCVFMPAETLRSFGEDAGDRVSLALMRNSGLLILPMAFAATLAALDPLGRRALVRFCGVYFLIIAVGDVVLPLAFGEVTLRQFALDIVVSAVLGAAITLLLPPSTTAAPPA